MDRKGMRGSKPKNVPPRDLFALGSKSSAATGSGRNSSVSGSTSTPSDLQQSQIEKSYGSKSAGGSSDRGREGSSGLIGKKSSKGGFHSAPTIARPGGTKPPPNDQTEDWERVAEEVDIEDLIPFIEAAEEREDYDRIEAYLCGAIKMLRAQRMKPDNVVCLTLLYLAKIKPGVYNTSNLIIEALSSLLKRGEHTLTFKSKSNVPLSVLVINILLAIFQEEKCWPEIFIKAFIEDSLGERHWVDHEDCKAFVDNIIASFKTKMPSKSLLFPDLGIGSKLDCPSPPVAISSTTDDGEGELTLDFRENLDEDVTNRYSHMSQEVEEMIVEAVQLQLNVRHPNVDAVARSFIRYLSAVCGILEVRKAIAPKLEIWLQNHKHQRLATELLMSLCLNCNTHTPIDQKVIHHIVHIRLKHKPLTNQYMACLRELLSAHPDNIAVVMKETIFNELSNLRNNSNMSILSVVFQCAPDHAAAILADIFLELLRNTEDFLRALRVLMREIIRSLRHDLQFQKFCQGLMKDQKDSNFRESFEFKERMFHSIVDLVVLCAFVSISPQIREASAQMARGDNRDTEPVRRYQEMVASIQQDSLLWMYRVAPKCYNPSKEEYVRCLHKLLMMDQIESYYHKDNWPSEGDRLLFFRLAFEVPLKQETLTRLLLIGAMKEQYIKTQELIELADKILKRVTALSTDTPVLCIDDTKIIDLIFSLCPYIPPENSRLPQGYRPPKTAISNLYWKAWTMILLITAHNPSVFGVLAWDSYPTLRAMMEMCITNSFVFPPPTMCIGDKGEEMSNQELMISSHERQQILEFESHLAQKAITETNSLLLSLLITMDPTGPARKPPLIVLEQLKALNTSNKIGNLLCRSRKPDFLLDIIQRQGAPQSTPWLAQLVQSSEDAFSGLPVQCLCEFLLSETVLTADGAITSKHHKSLQHLRTLLRYPQQDDNCIQIMEYFLRRLSSQQPGSRTQAVRGLHLIVAPITESMEVEPDRHEPYAWLLQHVPSIPGFLLVRNSACQALRSACQIETQPSAVSAYIRFLAIHTSEDSLQDMAALVQDMAQLIVERSTMISAILPSPDQTLQQFPNTKATLNSLFAIFINYMQAVRVPTQEVYPWSKNQDHVRVQWANEELAVMHILVVHAMVILLIYGPSAASDLFHQLVNVWFPENQEMPQAFLVDTTQEALLLPDWLKLKMIRSNVSQLVDAALKDLEPSQLVLFIQSFGIPVASMTKLLCALDLAVNTNEEAVAAAVLSKSHITYMAQLVEVQHQRGARGGHTFAATLGERDDLDLPSDRPQPLKPLVTPLKVANVMPMELNTNEVQSFIQQCFTSSKLHIDHKKQVKDTMRALQRHICREMSGKFADKPYLTELLRSFMTILQLPLASNFVQGLDQHYPLSAPLFRLLLQMKEKPDCALLYSQTVQIVRGLLHINVSPKSHLLGVWNAFVGDLESSDVQSGRSSSTVQKAEMKDFRSEEALLQKLTVSPLLIEKQIRELVEFAMKNGKIGMVVNAIVQLLVRKLEKEDGKDVPVQHIALLLDWLQVFDPELFFIPRSLSKLLLFGKAKMDDKKDALQIPVTVTASSSKGACSQVYLLSAFTHQATWQTLERCLHELLTEPDRDLNPTAVLDFVYAVLNVPKLWQGREKRKPRHIRQHLLLKLSPKEILNLSQYILLECKMRSGTTSLSPLIQKRIPLVFHCMGENYIGMDNIVKSLTASFSSKSEDDTHDLSSQLLYQYYLQRPCIIRYLSTQDMTYLTRVQLKSTSQSQSAADVSVHTLLMMLTSPLPVASFVKKMEDLEAAVRKMASVHPLLVIRQLPLLSATLQGLSHLQMAAFQSKNYQVLFIMILGILEILQPYVFLTKYRLPFCKTLDAFIELFEEHGRSRELGGMLMRFCQLLLSWVGLEGRTASAYIAKHGALFSMLLRRHPDMIPLRSLAAIAASRGTDHPQAGKGNAKDAEDNLLISKLRDGPPLPPWILQQVRELHSQFESFQTSEEQEELLSRVADLGRQSIGNAIVPFIHHLSEGLLSRSKKVRFKCWELVPLILRKNPHLSLRISRAVLNALNSEDLTVAVTAVRHLQEVILLLHEHAPDLLTAGFNVCSHSEDNSNYYLYDAIFLLTIDTGA